MIPKQCLEKILVATQVSVDIVGDSSHSEVNWSIELGSVDSNSGEEDVDEVEVILLSSDCESPPGSLAASSTSEAENEVRAAENAVRAVENEEATAERVLRRQKISQGLLNQLMRQVLPLTHSDKLLTMHIVAAWCCC